VCYEESDIAKQRERERKERREILNEDGKKIRWLQEIWKGRKRIEKERRKKIIFEIVIFIFVPSKESEKIKHYFIILFFSIDNKVDPSMEP
jgi:hypothetical protein